MGASLEDNGMEPEIDKHQKFLAASAESVRKAIVAIDKIGKYSNRRQYEYSEEEVEKMFAAIQESIDRTKEMFREKKEFSW